MNPSEQHLQHLFQQARTEPLQTTSEQVFGAFMTSLASGGTGAVATFFTLKSLSIMLLSSALIASVALLFHTSTPEVHKHAVPELAAAVVAENVQHQSIEQTTATAIPTPSAAIGIASTTAAEASPEPTPELTAQPVNAEQPAEQAQPDLPAEAAMATHPQANDGGDPRAKKKQKQEAPPAHGDTTNTESTSETGIVAILTNKGDIEPVNVVLTEAPEEGTIVTYVLTPSTTFDELKAMAAKAHSAGIMLRYDVKIKKDKIKKLDIFMRMAGETSNCRTPHIVASGNFIRNIGWEENDQGKVLRILQ